MKRWIWKFACALRGVAVGMRGQNSFYVHVPAAIVACIMAAWLDLPLAEWLVVVLCITVVLSAELINSAIEHLARAVTREEHPEIRDALDIASGAVLVASIGASAVGVVLLVSHCS
ncbi:diacylglycerol kinase family protein [Aeoliella sp.]|uniref:diacylglycerol kinase family protein n=1 Tax=Aeoliella sp. TaxID=2795800 RepID=UPI003CCC0604